MENTVEVSAQVLKIALIGLLTLQSEIKIRVEEIQNMLTPSPAAKGTERTSQGPRVSAVKKQPGQKRKLSAAARARIAEAQKKRWADFRKRTKPAAKIVSAEQE